MGYMRHDAIIVTSWNAAHLDLARDKAVGLGLLVSPVIDSRLNGYASFLIAPDGSKEGWPESDTGDASREAWKLWARENSEIYVDWAHVNFGGDDDDCSTLRDHSGAEAPAPDSPSEEPRSGSQQRVGMRADCNGGRGGWGIPPRPGAARKI